MAERRLWFLEPEELAKLLDISKEPDARLLIRLLAFTGCRVSEILALRPADIDYARRVIEVPALKTRNRETKLVVLDRLTLDLLKIHTRGRPKDRPVLPFSRNQAWKVIRAAGVAIGVPDLHPHTLRHTFAVNWVRQGGDLLKLQRQLGHKKQSTTSDMYIHFATRDIADDYDKVFSGRQVKMSLEKGGK